MKQKIKAIIGNIILKPVNLTTNSQLKSLEEKVLGRESTQIENVEKLKEITHPVSRKDKK